MSDSVQPIDQARRRKVVVLTRPDGTTFDIMRSKEAFLRWAAIFYESGETGSCIQAEIEERSDLDVAKVEKTLFIQA